MIPWFFKLGEITDFSRFSEKKRLKKIDEQRENVSRQKKILLDNADVVRSGSRQVSRRIAEGDSDRATEGMISVALTLKNTEPALSNYVKSLLLLRFYEIMNISGYVDPSMLPAVMKDIDYGLYSLSAEKQLEDLIRGQVDPLAALGINLDDD